MRSEAWRPAAAARNRSPREAGAPPSRHYDLGARSSLHGSGRHLPAVVGRRAPKEPEARPREPKTATVERREASVPRHGTQRASQAPGVSRHDTPHGCSAEHPNVSRRSAHPSIRVSEAKVKSPGRKNAPRERWSVVMSAAKKRTRAEEAQAAAEQRRLAPVLREAHARLGLWRTCDDKTCRRTQSCGREADQW